MRIDVPVLVTGPGPGGLVVAKVASARGLAGLIVGHEITGSEEPVVLTDAAVAALTQYGLFDVLRPYLLATAPAVIAPAAFEEVLKHHCVVDLTITVYDGMAMERDADATVLTDGRSRWEVHADHVVDATALPAELNPAIVAGAALAAGLRTPAR